MQLDSMPLVIGYRLDKALELLDGSCSITVDYTSTPYDDRKAERQGKPPVVVRQRVIGSTIVLTASIFK